ncbi:autophagy protein Apg5-domain-containing protein [Mrakia frigida]|uniref:autophagy protein 5 n=1 Tax=Mrakia frigida TaxID=29902 RepID=UPI003FCC02DF
MASPPSSQQAGSSTALSALSTATLFRRLLWQGSVPVQVRIAPADLIAAGGPSSDVDCYFIQAPRHSYLPLLLTDIRENLVELLLDDASLASTREQDWWFEDEGGGTGAMKWHWPIGLLYDHSLINSPSTSSAPFPPPLPPPLKIILHLSSPPSDKLLLSNSIEACKTAFMGSVKEADFVRWGNVKRVTGLRRGEQDGLWESVKTNDFDLHSRVSLRLVPLPSPPTTINPSTNLPYPPSLNPLDPYPSTPNSSITPNHSFSSQQQSHQPPSRPGSTEPGGQSSIGSGRDANKPDWSLGVRSIPCKVFLPEGAMVVQEVVPPFSATGQPSPTTLSSYLQTHLPLLFPPSSPDAYSLAFPIVQGIVPPPDSEMAWLGACFVGADGWVSICVGLR